MSTRYIIGLTGPFGAGKGTVAAFLKQRGYRYYSCSDMLREELKRKGVSETIDHLIELGNSLRAEEGPGVLGKRVADAMIHGSDDRIVVDSLRHPAEIEEVKKAGKCAILCIDAPIEVRYARIQKRGRAGDQVDFATFQKQEAYQKQGTGSKANLLDSSREADAVIANNASVEVLQDTIRKVLTQFSFPLS